MSASIIIKKSGSAISAHGNRAQRPRISGVFPATQFGEQVVSTGIPSLDGYIGGGVLLGSIVVIKDDYPSRYADLILKCFLAEGASYNHYLFVAAGNIDSAKFADELPSLKKDKASIRDPKKQDAALASSVPSSPDESENLKIAWRYKYANPLPVTLSSRGGIVKGQKLAKFEFTKRSSVKDLGGTHVYVSKLETKEDFSQPTSMSLLHEIASQMKLFDLTNTVAEGDKVSNNLLRVGISHYEHQILDANFMFGLRSLVQSTNSCAIITVSNLSCDPKLLSRVEHLADTVIQLETVLDEKKKGELGNVDGLCKVQKINSVNSLKLFIPPSDLGFSYKKKRITFQELHLPPEGETTTQRETGHTKTHQHPSASTYTSTCGSTVKGAAINIDF